MQSDLLGAHSVQPAKTDLRFPKRPTGDRARFVDVLTGLGLKVLILGPSVMRLAIHGGFRVCDVVALTAAAAHAYLALGDADGERPLRLLPAPREHDEIIEATGELTMKQASKGKAALAVVWLFFNAGAARAGDRVETLLSELSVAPGPPGFEEQVRAIMVRELRPLAKISYDGMGSVIAEQGATGPRIMLDAHMDELGAMTRRITPDGFVTMQMLGGWLDQALPGQRWVILTAKGPVKAISGIRDIHVTPSDERTKPFSRDNLYLDIGARSAAEAEALGVAIGDPVAPDVSFEELAGGRYAGKAWDDRVGCAVVIEVMRRLVTEGHPNRLFVAATTQEEIGLRGAHTAAERIRPDVAIAIEGGMAGDQPATHPEETNGRLGGGPSVFLYDTSAQPNRKLVAFLKETARATQTMVQYDLVSGYGDDSAEIQKSGDGVPTVNIGVPVRYMHVHNGVMDRKDFDATVNLVSAMISHLDSAEVTKIRDFAP